MVNSSGSYTVSTLSATAGITAAGTSVQPVKIASVQSATSGYVSDSATAVSTSGGYLIITGSGFQSGCQVLIGSTYAAATTFVNSTTLNVQVNATSSGTYPVYVVNTDGSVGIKVPGVVFDAYPVWSTGATLPQQIVDSEISISLSATDSNSLTYSVTQGSTLPSGLSLSSGGLLSGTITGITSQTTYSFSIDAVDSTYNEKTARTFSVTVVMGGDTYFNLTTLLLNGEGTAATNGATNNTFLDTSLSGLTITRNGTPTQGTFTPYSQNGWSNYFTSNSDYLSIASTSAFNLASNNFTIEGWVYLTGAQGASGQGGAILGKWTIGSTAGADWFFGILNPSTLYFACNTSGGTGLSSSTPISYYTWTHVAIVRNSNNFTLYQNGVSVGTSVFSGAVQYTGSTAVRTSVWDSVTSYFLGYMSNVRLVNGSAIYTTSFTPSSSLLTAVTNTSLLTCQSNRFIDNSTNNATITVNGTASVQAFAPFNPTIAYRTTTVGGSMYYNGSTDFLSTTGIPVPQTGQFTIEAWIYTQVSAIQIIYGQYTSADANRWTFLIDNNSGYKLSFAHGTAASVIGTTVVPLNQWNHVAVTRDASNTLRMFLNGAVDASQSSYTASLYQGGTRIGFWNNSPTYYFNGYISNLRVVNGTAIYTSTFSVPSTPLTAISNTSLLLTGTNGGIIDQSGRNNLTTVGDAKISTVQKKYGSSSMLFDGTGDYLKIPNSQNFNFGSGNFTVEGWVYCTNTSSRQDIFTTPANASGFTGLSFAIYNGNFDLTMSWTGAWDILFATAGSVSANTWYHFAVVRNGGTVTVYINGTSTYSNSGLSTSSLVFGSDPATISYGRVNQSDARYLYGYIDDLRITKGFARYTANFTAPTETFPGK
jgi:hypothetical protein